MLELQDNLNKYLVKQQNKQASNMMNMSMEVPTKQGLGQSFSMNNGDDDRSPIRSGVKKNQDL